MILSAVSSHINIANVNFFNNLSPNGLINIQNGSNIYVEQCTVEHNGEMSKSAISVEYNSSAIVNNSTFTGNSAYYGGCLSCLYNSAVSINNSNFINNAAVYGRTIFCGNQTPHFQTMNRTLSIDLQISLKNYQLNIYQ